MYKAFGNGLSSHRGKKAVSAKPHDMLRWSSENNVIWTAYRAK